MTLLPLMLKKDQQADAARSARLLRDRADNLLQMEADLAERERELRQRSRALDEQERGLAARARAQGERESRKLDSIVNETLEHGRALLFRDEQPNRSQGDTGILAHADEIVGTSIDSSRYDASKVAAAIVAAGRARRGESDEQTNKLALPVNLPTSKPGAVAGAPVDSPLYDAGTTARAIILAGMRRRGEIE